MFHSDDCYPVVNQLFHSFETALGEISLVVRKQVFCICENKDAEADQRLCFRYTDSTIPLLPQSEISSL